MTSAPSSRIVPVEPTEAEQRDFQEKIAAALDSYANTGWDRFNLGEFGEALFVSIRCTPEKLRATAAAIRSAAPVLPSATEWRSIDSAPKDGTHILALGVRGEASPPTTVHWFGPPDLPGLRSGGWYISVQQDEGGRVYPTKWHPLPPDPPAPLVQTGKESAE